MGLLFMNNCSFEEQDGTAIN